MFSVLTPLFSSYILIIPLFSTKKGAFAPLIWHRFVKNDVLFVFNSKYMAKISDVCNELQKTKKITLFFSFYMPIARVCRVCNKFLKDTKRSNALYCSKRCKNKAVTLRKNETALKQPETPKTIDIEHPLYGAPNIYDLYKRASELQGNLLWHNKHSQQIRELDDLREKIRQIELSKQKNKQAIQDKLANGVLFVFTNIIDNLKKDKPQSGLMPISSNDFDDF